jgi:hypothetical protein
MFKCALLGKWLWALWRYGTNEIRGRELWWTPNTTVLGVGVLLSLQEPLGWGCGSSSEKVEILSLALLDLLWGMAPGLAFGMICGVETRPLR